MRFHVAVDVMPRREISDPQGQTIERALPSIGFEGFEDVRVGKRITLVVSAASEQEAETAVEQACQRFLTNPAIEEFTVHVEALESA